MRPRSLLYGVGVNDADYQVSPLVSGRQIICKYYARWVNMLKRCYCLKFNKNRSNYDGYTVCEEWHTFSNFKTWMETQDWEGKELDKDLRGNGKKVYSPETCTFVTREVNLSLRRKPLDRKTQKGL